KHELLKMLFNIELADLLGRLLRDEGTVLDAADPELFDHELDDLLQEYGPSIWPELGQGNRDHLCQPRPYIRYASDLVYPILIEHLRRCTLIRYSLKEYLRGIILWKQTYLGIDAEAEITQTHTQAATQKGKRRESTDRGSQSRSQHTRPANNESKVDSESENCIMSTRKRLQTRIDKAHPREVSFQMELRLYRKSHVVPPRAGPVNFCGSLMLTEDCETSNDCFSRICEAMKTDCNFMVFQIPEDMSEAPLGRIRINRGFKDSDEAFSHVLYIFQKARKFPCGPPYRSVEVEVGLDM
ncbi:hypothetical protein EJ02DRAFT_333514, partial [Clathrospora elynae]